MHTVFQLLQLWHDMRTKMPPASFDGLRRRGPGTESVWQSIVEAHLSDAAARHTRPAAPAAACGRSCERKSVSHASFGADGNAAKFASKNHSMIELLNNIHHTPRVVWDKQVQATFVWPRAFRLAGNGTTYITWQI